MMSSSYFANAEYTDSKHFISINLEDSGLVHISENEYSISIISEYPCILKLHDNKTGIDTIVYAHVQGNTVELSLNGYTYPAYILNDIQYHYQKLLQSSNVTSKSVNKLLAPMPGLLKEVLCTEGKRVRKGETLFVLEAMKMENSIKSPVHGIVSKVSTQIGKAIEKGSVLCIIQTLDN